MSSVRVERFVSNVDLGLYDAGVFQMEAAIKRRAHALRVQRSTKDYKAGDCVTVNHLCFYKHLRGAHGVVVSQKWPYVMVELSIDGEKTRYQFAPAVIDKDV